MTLPRCLRPSAVSLVLAVVVGCGPRGSDTSSETCTPAYQYASRDMLGADLAGVSYCWGPDATRGRWDRDDTPTCTSDPDELASACSTSEPDAPCSTDADCGGGQCTTDGYTSCACVATCASDEDCASTESCLCASAKEAGTYGPAGASTCLPSECTSSADCEGSPCGLTQDICQQSVAFYCHASDDACLWDSDCAGNELCEYSEQDGRWACQQMANCE